MKELNVVKFLQTNNNYFEDCITRSVHNSNAIEGFTLSYADTYAIVLMTSRLKYLQTREKFTKL